MARIRLVKVARKVLVLIRVPLARVVGFPRLSTLLRKLLRKLRRRRRRKRRIRKPVSVTILRTWRSTRSPAHPQRRQTKMRTRSGSSAFSDPLHSRRMTLLMMFIR